ncbi:hypothetical protein OAN24_01005 [Pseudodesulfovibrio sp.]|nr:hypothetical protein [Pseudodesulfovibrio sp.]
MKHKAEDFSMLFEIGFMSLGIMAVSSIAALFFCCIEIAPIMARRKALADRYIEPGNGIKPVCFW